MSWKKFFAADDVSTRKVERVLDVNFGCKRSCRVELIRAEIIIRATCTHVSGKKCHHIRLLTSVAQKRFRVQETAWRLFQKESRTDHINCAMTQAGSL